MTTTLIDLETGLRHWLDRWSDGRDVLAHRRRADETRIAKYILPYLGRRSVTRLTTDQIEEWVETLRGEQVGASTIYAALMVLRQTLDLAMESGVITKNPARGIRLEDAKSGSITEVSPDQIVTEKQVQAILKAMDPAYAPMVLLAARTGIRWDEALGLQVRDVSLRAGRMYVGRHRVAERVGLVAETPGDPDDVRVIDLSDDVVASLSEFLKATKTWRTPDWNWLFLTKRDHKHPMRPNFNIHVWRPALREAGLDERFATFHGLRHTAAVRMIEEGMSVEDITRVLGHSSEIITRKMYRHWLLQREARRKRDAR